MSETRPGKAPPPSAEPALEVILCAPRESLRWATHDYPHHLAKWHYHPEYELHLVRETSGRMMIGDHVGPFSPGSLVLTGPNLPHNWVSTIETNTVVPERDVLVQFSEQAATVFVRQLPEFEPVAELLDEAAFGIEFTGPAALRGAEKLCAIGEREGPARLILFLELLVDLAADRTERRTLSRCAPSLGVHTHASRRLERAIEHLGTHFRRDIALKEVSALCNMEATAFSRFFKHQTGHNFSAYVNHLRVQAACQLLVATDAPITRICYETGFNNTANFNRRFQDICGVTPSRYRANARDISRPTPATEARA